MPIYKNLSPVKEEDADLQIPEHRAPTIENDDSLLIESFTEAELQNIDDRLARKQALNGIDPDEKILESFLAKSRSEISSPSKKGAKQGRKIIDMEKLAHI